VLLPLLAWLLSALVGRAAGGSETWKRIAPFFEVPAEFRSQYSDCPSPLKFYDGRPVATPADWARRRQEILDYWHSVLGPWPRLIERPRLERAPGERRENFTQHRVKAEVSPGFMQSGILLVPDGKGPFPAVLVVYYDAATSAGLPCEYFRPLNPTSIRTTDFARQLTKRGFVTLSISSPGGNAAEPELNGAKCQPLSYLAYIAANCHTVLAQLAEVDPRRIGIMGHSYGSKWTMFASCLYDKFACAVWSDGGMVFDEVRGSINYWDSFYLGYEGGPFRPRRGMVSADNPRLGAYKRLMAEGHNLHELHALMAPRPFLVSGGSEDYPARWQVLNHAVEVNRFLGYTNRVAMHNRPEHPPTAESNEIACDFLEHFLK
jgi:hypothetical protein